MLLFVITIEQIGPNVSISANVRVAAGVRLMSCIILDDAEIQVQEWSLNFLILSSEKLTPLSFFFFVAKKENAFVMYAIVGWKSSLGKWSRVQASSDSFTCAFLCIFSRIATCIDD